MQWLAQGSESADLKPGEPRVAGVYRCGKTVFQLQMDAAWDAAHGVLSYWMPGVSAMTPRVEYMDVMQAAELSLAAAAEKKWRRTDGGGGHRTSPVLGEGTEGGCASEHASVVDAGVCIPTAPPGAATLCHAC